MNMKKLPLLIVLSAFYVLSFAQQSETDLQLHKLQDDLALHKREVAVQIRESQATNNINTWGHIAAILLAILSGPITIAIRSKLDKKRLEELATEKTKAEMEASFPAMAKKLMGEYLAKEVPARVNAVLGAANQHEEETKLRQTTSILIVADTDDLAQYRAQFLRELGYLNLNTSLPKKLDQLPAHEICFVEHPGREDSYPTLNNRYIQALINDFSSLKSKEQGIFFYFSSRCEGLDFSLLGVKGMCNMESKVEENLMGLIKQLTRNKK